MNRWMGWGCTVVCVAALPFTVGEAHADPSPVTALLFGIKVVDHIDKVEGYDRLCTKGHRCVFGPAWNDPNDHSGCDTRNRVLRAHLKDIVFKQDRRNPDCKVIAGWEIDPYTGRKLVLGVDRIEIDHVVPLHLVWNSGAFEWTPRDRQIFANKETNLLPVSKAVNDSKGDKGIGDWLPQVEQCQYVMQYLTVVADNHLVISKKDRAAAIRSCPT